VRSVHQHKSRDSQGFSARYGVDRLVWFESYDDPIDALRAKGSSRSGAGIGRFG
jgi:putative endonuclease